MFNFNPEIQVSSAPAAEHNLSFLIWEHGLTAPVTHWTPRGSFEDVNINVSLQLSWNRIHRSETWISLFFKLRFNGIKKKKLK